MFLGPGRFGCDFPARAGVPGDRRLRQPRWVLAANHDCCQQHSSGSSVASSCVCWGLSIKALSLTKGFIRHAGQALTPPFFGLSFKNDEWSCSVGGVFYNVLCPNDLCPS